jgi:hypothetical protein
MVSKITSWLRLDPGLLLALCTAVLSVAAWSTVVWGFWRGIDLTDEGYYLNSISSPFLYKSSYSQFGFLLHPIYILVGGDLILLRLAGLLLLTSAAAAFVSTFLRLPVVSPALPPTARLVLTLGGSCAVLLSYSQWIPTPNYNLLNLFGVLMIFTGWFRIFAMAGNAASGRWQRPMAIVICALGFAIVALVKPTTAAALAIGITAFTLPFGRRALMDVVIAGSLSLLLVVLVLLAIDGNPSTVILRYRNALADNELAQSGHDPGSLFKFFDWKLGAEMLLGIFAAYLLGRRTIQDGGMDRRYIAVLAALIFAPIAVAFGTNTGVLSTATRSGIFWMSAIALVIIVTAPPNMRLPLFYFGTAVSACRVFIVLLHAVQTPYRVNGPLREQTEWISSAVAEHVVKADPATADYFRTLLTGARSAGFQIGTPIVDMTGTGPTTIYILGGEAAGLAWMTGGYPGSGNLALHALSQVPAEKLRRSWILTAPSGHEPLPVDILASVGLNFPDGYQEVTRAQTSFVKETHVLWRPRDMRRSDVFYLPSGR